MTSDRRVTEERDVRSDDATVATAAEDDAVRDDPAPLEEEGPVEEETAERGRARRKRATAARAEADPDDDDATDDDDGRRSGRGRLAVPLVPVLAVLLVLLLAGLGYLWFTRPAKSPVTTADYVEALQAARSAVVDLTSFDYLTLDDDIEQIRRITTGDLREEAVAQLDDSRQTITDSEATVNTEIVAAAVTAVDADDATVLLVIQSTQENNQSDQAQVTKYRIQATLEKVDDRWLLSGITGR